MIICQSLRQRGMETCLLEITGVVCSDGAVPVGQHIPPNQPWRPVAYHRLKCALNSGVPVEDQTSNFPGFDKRIQASDCRSCLRCLGDTAPDQIRGIFAQVDNSRTRA